MGRTPLRLRSSRTNCAAPTALSQLSQLSSPATLEPAEGSPWWDALEAAEGFPWWDALEVAASEGSPWWKAVETAACG